MNHLLNVAFRNLTRNVRRSLLAASAVFFGVLALLAIRSTLNGLQAAMRGVLVDHHSGALQVHAKGYLKQVIGTPLSLHMVVDAALLEKINAVPHVAAVSPRLLFGAMVSVEERSAAAVVTAFEPGLELAVCPGRAGDVVVGHMMEGTGVPGMVAAASLAQRLHMDGSSQAALITGDVDGVFNAVDVKLSGTTGLPNVPGLEARTVWIPLEAARELVRIPHGATELAIRLDDLAYLQETRTALAGALGPEFEVSTWEELAPAVKADEKNQEVIFAVLTLVFLIAALVGITNTTLINVLDRTREIGTMMAVGTRRRRIMALFLAEGTMLGVVGCLGGILGGLLFVAVMGRLGFHITAVGGGVLHVYPFLVATQAAGLTALCAAGAALACWYPAWTASRLSPVEALAHV